MVVWWNEYKNKKISMAGSRAKNRGYQSGLAKRSEKEIAAEIERLQGVLSEKTGRSRTDRGMRASAQRSLDDLTGVTEGREKAAEIERIQGRLEKGVTGRNAAQVKRNLESKLAGLTGDSSDQADQAVEDVVKDESGDSFNQAVEAKLVDDKADPLSRKGIRKSLRRADDQFNKAFGEGISDYESRMADEQEESKEVEALFKDRPKTSPRDRSGSGERIRKGNEVLDQLGVDKPTSTLDPMGSGADMGSLIIDDGGMEPDTPEMDEKESGRLFKMIMGGSFDPASSMDKGKMEILKKAKAENPDLTDNQLALKIYRDYM